MSEHKLCKTTDIPEGTAQQFEIDDELIAVCNIHGEFFAISDICSHAHAHLSEGQILDCKIVCPLHGAEFDIKTGKALKMPAVASIPIYPLRIDGNEIKIMVE